MCSWYVFKESVGVGNFCSCLLCKIHSHWLYLRTSFFYSFIITIDGKIKFITDVLSNSGILLSSLQDMPTKTIITTKPTILYLVFPYMRFYSLQNVVFPRDRMALSKPYNTYSFVTLKYNTDLCCLPSRSFNFLLESGHTVNLA